MKQKLAFFTFLLTLLTCLFGLGDPMDPLAIMVSNNPLVIVIKALFVGWVFWLSTNLYSGSQAERNFLYGFGGLLLAFSLWCLISTPFLSQLYNYMRALDVLVLMELGVLMLWTGLEMKIVPVGSTLRLPNFRFTSFKEVVVVRFVTYFTYFKYRYH